MYLDNLQMVYFYNVVEVDDNDEAEAEESEQYDGSGPAVYISWTAVKIHACLHPCNILDCYQVNAKEHYKAKMLPVDSSDRVVGYKLDAPHIVVDVPLRAEQITDHPYSSDMFLKMAFRHKIGVPYHFYPKPWMKKQLRSTNEEDDENDDLFKLKGHTKMK
jgi:hypothetical protein